MYFFHDRAQQCGNKGVFVLRGGVCAVHGKIEVVTREEGREEDRLILQYIYGMNPFYRITTQKENDNKDVFNTVS